MQANSDLLLWLVKSGFKGMQQKVKFGLAPRGPSGKTRAGYPGGAYFVVPARTRHPAAAQALISFFTHEGECRPIDRKWTYPFSRFSIPLTSVASSLPWYLARGYQTLLECRFPEQDFPLSGAALSLIENHVHQCLVNKVAPATALKHMASGIEALSRERYSPRISKALLRFGNAESETPSIAAVSEEVGLSRNHFTRLFVRATGRTPVRHVQERRIAAARRLLETTELPLDEVAQKSGFHSPKYFFRLFKRMTGQTPLAYRLSHL